MAVYAALSAMSSDAIAIQNSNLRQLCLTHERIKNYPA